MSKATHDKKIKYNLYLTSEQLALLKSQSRKTGAPVSELIRRAINEYIEQYPVEAIEAVKEISAGSSFRA